MSIAQILSEKKSERKFVAIISDFVIGRRLFHVGAPLEWCLTDDMTQGWLAAESTTLTAMYWLVGVAVGDAVLAATR